MKCNLISWLRQSLILKVFVLDIALFVLSIQLSMLIDLFGVLISWSIGLYRFVGLYAAGHHCIGCCWARRTVFWCVQKSLL